MNLQKWIEWLDIRDKITATGNHTEDRQSLSHIDFTPVENCDHPEAQWLWKTVGHCKTLEEVREVLRRSNDPRAFAYRYCYGDYHSNAECDELLERAIEKHDSFAHCLIALHRWKNRDPYDSYLHHSLFAADRGERAAMYILAQTTQLNNKEVSRKWLIKAADLGHHLSMLNYCFSPGRHENELRLARYYCTLYSCGIMHVDSFDEILNDILEVHDVDCIVEVARLIPVEKLDLIHNSIRVACLAMHDLIDKWEQKARDAIDAWTLCAKRMGLYRDVHLLISRILWENRIQFFSLRK